YHRPGWPNAEDSREESADVWVGGGGRRYGLQGGEGLPSRRGIPGASDPNRFLLVRVSTTRTRDWATSTMGEVRSSHPASVSSSHPHVPRPSTRASLMCRWAADVAPTQERDSGGSRAESVKRGPLAHVERVKRNMHF